jgi:ubiquinone/menaquinone biosynthesis C-methylase UbiE
MEKHPWVESERKFYEKNYKELIKNINLETAKKVLDYGSGTGGFASLLAEYNPNLKVEAVDINPEAIKLAKKHYKHLKNLEFYTTSEIPKGNYDLIFKNLVLHEIQKKGHKKGSKKAIEEILTDAYSKLKKEGQISILDNRRVSKENFKKIYNSNKDPNKGTFEEEYLEHNRFNAKDWKKMIEKVGFETKYSEEMPPNLFKYNGIKR